MNLAEDVAKDIWASNGFKNDYDHLLTTNLAAHLGDLLQNGKLSLNSDETARLIQSALIFAECENGEFREAAQRISTGILRANSDSLNAVEPLFRSIQARLKNFPSLQMLDNMLAPKDVPVSLQYEFISARTEQMVSVSADHKEIFTSFQKDAWSKLTTLQSTALSAPTSAGKSYVVLLYVLSCLARDDVRTVVYIVPTRALINQVAEDFQRHLSRESANNIVVSTVPVDMGANFPKLLYVVTQERLEKLLSDSPKLRVDSVIVDEAQTISDPTRGVLLESVLDRVLSGNPRVQLIFSGPLIANPDYFGKVFSLPTFQISETDRTAVTQNVVFLSNVTSPQSKVIVEVEGAFGRRKVGEVSLAVALRNDFDKLSYISFLFGRNGSSIVYAAGKADAEKIAIKIAAEMPKNEQVEKGLSDLISFVKRHVHKDYALASTLEKGVGFHYGHMPTLLRKELEDHFKARKISHVVCTSTLLYGLNLPAKNIFLLKPQTGRNTPIDGPDFWNLAGRVGRLGKEIEGNVYLIDYDEWPTKPLEAGRRISVVPALKTALVENAGELLEFLKDPNVASEAKSPLEIAAGKLVLDHRTGRLESTLERYMPDMASQVATNVRNEVERISKEVDIPSEIINRNIAVSVFRQRDLLNYFVQRMGEIAVNELIPAHPVGEFKLAQANYLRAFKRIHTYLLNLPTANKSHRLFAGLALRWMRGDGLPVLINSSIKWNTANKTGKSTARIIRDTMEQIEQDLRFRYVKYFTCYNSLLKLALERTGNSGYIASVPDVPLYLEMGGSSGVMINLMALGLSRTTANALADYVTDKDLNIDQLRRWLTEQDLNTFDISPICLREVNSILGRDILDDSPTTPSDSK